jgi:arylsulfatase A-like enzyme
MPLTSPHTPLVPTKEWQGKSGLGDYGDFVMETDWAVGEVLAELDRSGAGENTLVLLSSDNGCAPYVGDSRQVTPPGAPDPNSKKDTLSDYQKYQQLEALGHFSSYPFRGHKADIWEGGHRIPLLARWPAKVKAGSVSDQLVCLMDFMATCAEIAGAKIPDNAGEDSVSLLPALLGEAGTPLRGSLVSHSINGSFAIRQGRWKLELCPDSGGWGDPKPGSKEAAKLPPVQLYDMAKDPVEQTNVASDHPEIVAQLTALLEKQVADGRSTPGPKQANDAPININKPNEKAPKE